MTSLSGKCGDNAFYSISDDDVLTISGTGDMYDYGTEEGSFTPWHKEYYHTIVIENGITRIGNNAFVHCSARDIAISDSVTVVGKYAFSEMSQAETVQLPESVVTIEEGAFANSTFSYLHIPKNVKEIPDKMCYCSNEIKEITIPEGIEKIGESAFESCESLQEMKLPDTLTAIGGYAFGTCWGIKELTIPEKVNTIGSDAFFVWEDDQTIYVKGKTEAAEGWDDDWMSEEVKVVWNA